MYQDGKVVAQNNPPNSPILFELSVPVKAGSRYLIVVEGATGDPYGGYRGHPGVRCCISARSYYMNIASIQGRVFMLASLMNEASEGQWIWCRLKWKSGNAFAKIFDAAPTSVNASQFLRVDGHNLVIGCKRYGLMCCLLL